MCTICCVIFSNICVAHTHRPKENVALQAVTALLLRKRACSCNKGLSEGIVISVTKHGCSLLNHIGKLLFVLPKYCSMYAIIIIHIE